MLAKQPPWTIKKLHKQALRDYRSQKGGGKSTLNELMDKVEEKEIFDKIVKLSLNLNTLAATTKFIELLTTHRKQTTTKSTEKDSVVLRALVTKVIKDID